MKFDPNLIRDILISVSESISPDEYGFLIQINVAFPFPHLTLLLSVLIA